MSGLKTIRRRITSVKNTKQITRAMKLVSAAKLRRAQDALQASRGFIRELEASLKVVLNELGTEFDHPLLVKRAVTHKTIAFIGGERGLSGGYNANLVKYLANGPLLQGSGKPTLLPIGKRAESSAKRLSHSVGKVSEVFQNDPSTWPVSELVKEVCKAYADGTVDEFSAFYTHFVTPMTQEVRSQTLLPLKLDEIGAVKSAKHVVATSTNPYLIEPDPVAVFEALVPLYLGEKLRLFGLEARASEHAARMTAMDSATRNADDLIEKLKLYYNRARQSAITRELIDIVGGAEAIS